MVRGLGHWWWTCIQGRNNHFPVLYCCCFFFFKKIIHELKFREHACSTLNFLCDYCDCLGKNGEKVYHTRCRASNLLRLHGQSACSKSCWAANEYELCNGKYGLNPLHAGTGFWRPLQTVWIQMIRHRTWRLIRIQTVCYSDSILWKKIEENADFRNSADDILADDKFPSMQRFNACVSSAFPD